MNGWLPTKNTETRKLCTHCYIALMPSLPPHLVDSPFCPLHQKTDFFFFCRLRKLWDHRGTKEERISAMQPLNLKISLFHMACCANWSINTKPQQRKDYLKSALIRRDAGHSVRVQETEWGGIVYMRCYLFHIYWKCRMYNYSPHE